MLVGVLCLLAGIVSALALPVMPDARFGVAALALAVAVSCCPRLRPCRFWWLGLGMAMLDASASLDERLPPQQTGRDWLLEGEVETVLSDRQGRQSFLFLPDDVGRARQAPGRIRLAWYDPPQPPAAGERWRLTVRLRDPRGTANPHGFDYERWLLSRRIGATGYVRPSSRNARLNEAGGVTSHVRKRIATAIETHLGDTESGRLLKALLTGNRTGLSADTRAGLLETGTAHLLAISGLHVGIAAGTGGVAGRLVGRIFCPILGVAAVRAGWVGAAIAAIAYAALVGPSVATRRALAMVLLVCLAGLARRTSPLSRGLALAGWLVLLTDPLAALDGGFWLSFGAVAILTGRFMGRLAVPGKLQGLFEAQASISLGMIVPSLVLFGFIATAGPIVNLVAVPLVALVVLPAGFVGAMPGLVEPALAGPPMWLAGVGLDQLLDLIHLAAARGPVAIEPAAAGYGALACGLAGSALLLAPAAWPGRRAAPALLAPLLLWQGSSPPPGAFDMTVLDVGQGLSVIIQTHRHALVYDAGPSWPGGDAGSLIVRPFLRGQGIRHLDALVLSHGDNDHMGGAQAIYDRVAGPILIGELLEIAPRGVRMCEAGDGWEWDGVRFEFLHPAPGTPVTGNDSSCVLRISSPHGSALLPGDIEAATERDLLAAGAGLSADVVVAAHHGSASSSVPAFVHATGARWVVYAAGYRNRWGFPRPEVERRWRHRGARAVTTGESGAVRFRFGPTIDGPVVQTYRCTSRRFWRWRDCSGGGPG